MSEEQLIKRNWIVRTVDIFHKLKLKTLYNVTNVREMLREECDDSISLPTTKELLLAIIYAQENGLQFILNNKLRKLIEKKTINEDSLFELIEMDIQ